LCIPQKTIEESYLLNNLVGMANIITIISSAVCGFFCISCCITCRKYHKAPYETEEEVQVITPINTTSIFRDDSITPKSGKLVTPKNVNPAPKGEPLIVGIDLATESIECPICMENYEVGQEIVILSCMHFYHKKCITTWNNIRNECPQCRETIRMVVVD